MTSKIIELKQAPVVLVELCKDDISYYNVDKYVRKGLEEEGFKYLSFLSDLTEEQFAEWAVKYPGNATPQRYVNHAHKDKYTGIQVARVSFPSTYRASDSCLSLLESENVYTENPYGDEPKYADCEQYENPLRTYEGRLRVWQKAQSRTIDPKRTVILIKTKN